MTNYWGNVAEWVGSIGTAGAFIWAVFLYRQNLRDKEISQARLLSIVRPPGRVRHNAGLEIKEKSAVVLSPTELRTRKTATGKFEYFSVTTTQSIRTTFHLVSKSDETFFIESVDILQKDGSTVPVPNAWPDVAPQSEYKVAIYYSPDSLGEVENYRVRFRDASDRRWERTNRRPVMKRSQPKQNLFKSVARKFKKSLSEKGDQ